MRKHFHRAFYALLLMVGLSCTAPATGTYKNVNGFAVLELRDLGDATLTIYGERLPCGSYTSTAEEVTLNCSDGAMKFARRGDQLVTMALADGKRFPFRGPRFSDFGEFNKTKSLSQN